MIQVEVLLIVFSMKTNLVAIYVQQTMGRFISDNYGNGAVTVSIISNEWYVR